MPQGASGTAASGALASGVGSAALPAQYEYAVGAPTTDYFADYYATPATYAYDPYYPAYAAYPAYYGYPSVAVGFGYWCGSGCCWGRGYGWHGGGTGWQGGGGYFGGRR